MEIVKCTVLTENSDESRKLGEKVTYFEKSFTSKKN